MNPEIDPTRKNLAAIRALVKSSAVACGRKGAGGWTVADPYDEKLTWFKQNEKPEVALLLADDAERSQCLPLAAVADTAHAGLYYCYREQKLAVDTENSYLLLRANDPAVSRLGGRRLW